MNEKNSSTVGNVLNLVHDVSLRDGEGGDPGENDEGDGVEPGPNIGQAPQAHTKLKQ